MNITNTTDNFAMVAQWNTNFSLALFRVISPNSASNSFMSPASLTLALAMTYAGSDGTTKTELRSAVFGLWNFGTDDVRLHEWMGQLIRYINKSDSNHTLVLANRLYAQKSFLGTVLPSYKEILSNYYHSELNGVDFKSDKTRSEINSWVKEKTDGKIEELIPSSVLDVMTRFVIVNAIYFKGNWKNPFNSESTVESEFYTGPTPKDVVRVKMMKQEDKFLYNENADFQMLALPYEGFGGDMAMLVFLPRSRDGLQWLKLSLTAEKIIQSIKLAEKLKVQVSIPKFKMEQSLNLVKAMESLGVKEMFSDQKADFSKINGQKDLYISDIFHKAYIEVNEEGTEAAAASGIVGKARSLLESQTFQADHPFLFLIAHKKTMTVLFMGQYVGPAGKQ